MATKSIAWTTGNGNITLTYQGQGDGTIIVTSDENNLGVDRSQTITIETTDGVIARNITVNQAACPIPVGTVLTYSYTGSYQEVTLPAGQYKLQCWGAQGGSNAAASSYGITAQAGGKGGYSEGIITLSQKTTVRVYVGGQGSSSAGGFNGGGSTTGSASYSTGTSGQSGYVYGTSRMGGGGGATDIRLSDGALLSRMIVAGGGSGGAMSYRKTITTTTRTTTFTSGNAIPSDGPIDLSGTTVWQAVIKGLALKAGHTYNLSCSGSTLYSGTGGYYISVRGGYNPLGTSTGKLTADSSDWWIVIRGTNNTSSIHYTLSDTYEETVTSTSNDSQAGFVGGGTNGGGYSSTYQGKQNAAGSGGSFGQGANQTITNYRHCSGAGGGGWYGGGGGSYSDSTLSNCRYSGGGSGFVNIAASAGNRPSGYTGLQLDSGETKAGNTSFPNTAGTGNETGHSGNGYAKITRLS